MAYTGPLDDDDVGSLAGEEVGGARTDDPAATDLDSHVAKKPDPPPQSKRRLPRAA